MNSLLFQISAYSSSIILKSARSIAGNSSSLYGSCYYSNLSWKRNPVSKSINLGSSCVFSRLGVVQCYSTKKKSPRKPKSKSSTEAVMEEKNEKDAYFVVRKGDVVGVYNTFSECQAQLTSSVNFFYYPCPSSKAFFIL